MPTWPFGTEGRYQPSVSCVDFHHMQSLCHVLNMCEKALHQRRFNPRHDSVLSIIHSFLLDHICDYQIQCDLPGLQYTFPPHIATTDERPDIVLWNDRKHSAILIELTIPFEDNFYNAHLRKTNRYHGLVQLCFENKYRTQLITIQVGSRGVIDLPSMANLETLCKPNKKVWHNFLVSLSQATISGFLQSGAVGTRANYTTMCVQKLT